jgi:PhnB protein
MLRCTPFLLFDGECAAAMTFYQEFLGGSSPSRRCAIHR